MIEFSINGRRMSKDRFMAALDAAQKLMIDEEAKIKEEFGVSDETSSAIFYLRTRSRWTQAKEDELIRRDRAGNPISLGTVLSGEF